MSVNPPEPSIPPVPPMPPIPPTPPQGGRIWLGILIAVVVPILAVLLAVTVDPSSGAGFTIAVVLILATVATAIVLTCIRSTQRTGIGMWIGIAALPIIFFGVCTALVFGSGL